MTLAVLVAACGRARASRPIPARLPAVLTMMSVTSELPMAKTYWATSSITLVAATGLTTFHCAQDGASKPEVKAER